MRKQVTRATKVWVKKYNHGTDMKGGGTQNRINEVSKYQSGMKNQKEVREQVRRWGVRWNRWRGWVSAGGTVKKTGVPHAGAQHVATGKFRHPRRSGGPIYVDDEFFRSIYVDDGIFRHPLSNRSEIGGGI
jgi:hypothetical protein